MKYQEIEIKIKSSDFETAKEYQKGYGKKEKIRNEEKAASKKYCCGSCGVLLTKGYEVKYKKCKDCIRQLIRKPYEKLPEVKVMQNKSYNKYRTANKAKVERIEKESRKRRIENIKKSYARTLIYTKTNLKTKDVPDNLIKRKQLEIILYRAKLVSEKAINEKLTKKQAL